MNERIKELLKQATKTLNVKHEGYRGKGYTEQVEFFDKEKFAELIVKECIQVGGPEDSYTDDWFMAKAHSVAKIKQHFGVDE